MTSSALAHALTDRLERHYLHPNRGGMFAAEVGINGNFGASRRCDALYAGFTNSSGRILVGHEVKISRSDWLHELDQPTKADCWADACHAWYVVAPAPGIVPAEELPPGWGLMIPNRRSRTRFTVAVKAAVKPDEFIPPWWAVRSFMARCDTLATDDVNTRVAAAVATERYKLRREFEDRQAALDKIRGPLSPASIETIISTVKRNVPGARISTNEVIDALTRSAQVRAAASELAWELQNRLNAAHRIVAPFAELAAELEQLLSEASTKAAS